MNKVKPIETDLGVLYGRDCIFLNRMEQNNLENLTFIGEINGSLISKYNNEKRWFPYKLVFQHVLAYFSCELDTYENLSGTDYPYSSNFDFMEDSMWMQKFPIREDFEKERYKHFRLFTYDVVYNIIAVDYQMEIDV